MTDETSTSPRAGTPGLSAAPAPPPAAAPAPPPAAAPAPSGLSVAPAPPPAAAAVLCLPPPRLLRWEIVAVFAISLGGSGLYALVSYIGSLTAKQSLSSQAAVLNGTLAPGRPLFGLFLQLLNIALALAPVLMVFYLLARAGEGPADIGLDARHPVQDLGRGALLAAVIGGSGLALYLAAYHLGVELNVVAESLPVIWWRIPVLLLSAAQNAAVEEIIVVGYLMSLAGQAWGQAVPGHRPQRGHPRFLPPVPGRGRVPRQRGHGRHLRLPVPPVGPGHPAVHRAFPDRRRHLRRLRVAGRPRVLAAGAMNVLDRLWERVSGSQPLPPAWLIGATALAALIIVTSNGSWRMAGKVITIAHEGGHALVSVLSGRRLEGIRLHADSSGVTYSRGKRHGPGLVATAAAGYLAPPLLGAGAAALLAAGHETAMLWLALVLLAATLLAIRNAFGALAVLVTAGGVFAISYYASAAVQAGFGYLAVWFLLFGGMRPVLELTRRRRYRRGVTDADQLGQLTRVSSGVWTALFLLVSAAALAAGARLLVP